MVKGIAKGKNFLQLCPEDSRVTQSVGKFGVEELYKILVENLQDAITVFDLKGRCIFVNKAAETLTGYTQKEMMGKKPGGIIPRKYWSLGRKMDEKAFGGEPVSYFEIEIKRKDGKLVPVETGGQVIKLDGKIAGIMIITREIAKRKKTEEALKESEERYRNIVELAPDIIATSDLKGTITSFNTSGEKISGYSKEEIVGKHFSQIGYMRPQDLPRYLKLFSSLVRGKVPEPLEETFFHKNGTPRFVEVRVSLQKQNGKSTDILAIIRDITERKRTELAILENQRKFERLFMDNPEAAVYTDSESRILDINNRFTELFGYSLNEVKGKSLRELVVPEDKLEESKELRKNLAQGCSRCETVRKTKDEILIPVSISAAPIKIADEFLGAVVLYADISQHKKAEEAIKKSEERYRNLFENARDVILTLDLEGKITSVNRAINDYGFEKNELIGRSVFEFLPEEEWSQSRRLLEALANGNSVEKEIRAKSKLRKTGYAIVETRSNPIVEDGRVVGIQTILRDVTDRREAEEMLRMYSEDLENLVRQRTRELTDSETKYSVLVEESSDGVIIAQDEKIAFVNKRFAKIVGCPRDELRGMPFERIIVENYRQKTKERYMQVLRGEKVQELFETAVMSKNGEHVPIEVTSSLIHYQDRPADLIIARDIRERKRIEEQRRELEKLMTIGELATMVAHDLRNPLTSIRNASFYIRNICCQRTSCECKTATEMLDIIEQETLFANNIISSLLDFSIKRPLQKTEQNINAVIEDSITASNIPENIKVEKNFAENATANVDEKQLQRVFLNIIKNAVQAMPNGGKVAITTRENENCIEIAISDTGIGISEENIGKVFTPLFTTKARGIGLGLAICEQIVEEHGGKINVQSKISEGSTFTVKLQKKRETVDD